MSKSLATANHRRTTLRLLTWALALLALGATAAAYLNPHFVVDLATRAWACF